MPKIDINSLSYNDLRQNHLWNIRFNDKLAGPPEPTHCQNGSRRCVHKSGVICKIMRVLKPWTNMDTDFPMTLYEANSCAHTETCVHLRPVCPNSTPIRGGIRLTLSAVPPLYATVSGGCSCCAKNWRSWEIFNFSLVCLFTPWVYSHNSDGSACSGGRHGVCLKFRTLCRVGSLVAYSWLGH